MRDDAELLRLYAEEKSDDAFAELVRRHLDFVYSAALRQANGDAQLAKDAAQTVFTDLARKASSLQTRRVLAGWLFTSTRFAVSKLIRTERRRKAREEAAQLMKEIHDDPAANADWERVRPVLDEALADLSGSDREVVLLRYFEGRDFASVGAKLQLSENAARMRVGRALDKLHQQLRRRGFTSSSGILAAVLGNQAVAAAPAGLAVSITGSALCAGSASAGSAIAFVSINKIVLTAAAAIVITGVIGGFLQARRHADLRAELRQLRAENEGMAELKSENLRLAKVTAEVEGMRADDAVFAKLNDQAEVLKTRIDVAAAKIAAADAKAKADRNVHEVGELDRIPRAKSQVRPVFPPELRKAGVGGEVLVDFVVDSNGAVQNAQTSSRTPDELERAAINAVSQWTFDPGLKGGRMVNTHMQVPIVFSLGKIEPSTGEPTPVSDAKHP